MATEDPIVRYLSSRELARNWLAIEAALERKKQAWGAQGWSIQGKGSRLRVVVKVPFRRVNPAAAVAPIRIGGANPFKLKVGVEASFHVGAAEPTGRAQTRSRRGSNNQRVLAPGAPIEVVSGGKRRCGVGAVLELDGAPFLVTCGHTFKSSSGKVFHPGDDAVIAKLTRNLLATTPRIDAAICELTERGRQSLASSAQAATWFGAVHTPCAADNDKSVVFWPTHEQEPDPIDIDVTSFSAHFEPLFGPAGPSAFIEVELMARGGDSGSVMALGDAYYGLCSGAAGPASYFTSLSSVVTALGSDLGSIKPWQPK